MEKSKIAAQQWAQAGRLCTYRYGWASDGARARAIDDKEALRRLQTQSWDFTAGKYELSWRVFFGEHCLEFNELYVKNDTDNH